MIRKMKKKLATLILAAAVLIGWTSLSAAQEKYPEEPFLMESTAYYYGEVTKDGSKVRPGIVAAKEEWLGLTAILYEVDPDGTIGAVCGIYEIRDTGSDYRIRNGTCIDIYIPDKEECIEYGRQQVYIQLIQADG